MVVDTDMGELPADAATAVLSLSGDAVTDSSDAPEFLGIHVEQCTRLTVFVAQWGRGRRLERRQATEAQTPQHGRDRRHCHLEGSGNLPGYPAPAAQLADASFQVPRSPVRDPEGSRAAILQTGEPFLTPATDPLAHRDPTQAKLAGRLLDRLSVPDAVDDLATGQGSRFRVTMEMHPGSSSGD